MAPKISIVVPVYKIDERFFHECMQSLCNQTLKEVEIILVDDGSPDNCGKLCDDYAEMDSRVKVIHQENQGVSVARNRGMDAATAEWIMFVDGDDWLELDACEKTLEAATQYNCPDILLFSGWKNFAAKQYAYVPIDPNIFQCKTKEEMRRLIKYTLSPTHTTSSSNEIIFTLSTVWCRLFRKTFLIRLSLRFLPSIPIGEDVLFMLNAIINAQTIAYYDAYLYHYRIINESAMHRYRENAPKVIKGFLIHLKSFVSSISEDRKDDVWNAYVSRVITATNWCMEMCFDHPDNPNSFGARLRACRQFMNDPIIQEGIRMARLSSGSFKWKVQILCLRLHLFFVLSFLFRINRFLSGKKAAGQNS